MRYHLDFLDIQQSVDAVLFSSYSALSFSAVNKLNGKPPTFHQLREMKYVKWVLSETLRLYPVLPINTRTALRDTIIALGGGPKGKSPIFIPRAARSPGIPIRCIDERIFLVRMLTSSSRKDSKT